MQHHNDIMIHTVLCTTMYSVYIPKQKNVYVHSMCNILLCMICMYIHTVCTTIVFLYTVIILYHIVHVYDIIHTAA
jgi:hypothetical protein